MRKLQYQIVSSEEALLESGWVNIDIREGASYPLDARAALTVLNQNPAPERVVWQYSNGVVNAWRFKPPTKRVVLRNEHGTLLRMFDADVLLKLGDATNTHYFGRLGEGQRFTLTLEEVDDETW